MNEEKKLNKKGLFVAVVIIIIVLFAVWYTSMSMSQKPSLPKVTEEVKAEIINSAIIVKGKILSMENGAKGVSAITFTTAILNFNLRYPAPVEKEITVKITPETIMGGYVEDLKKGATITITLNESVYKEGPFIAKNIFVNNLKKQVKVIDVLGGTITKIDGDVIVVETKVVDAEAFSKVDTEGSFTVPYVTKEYLIKIDDSTKFMDSGYDFTDGKGLIPGFQVMVWGNGDLYNLSTFTATKILIIPFK